MTEDAIAALYILPTKTFIYLDHEMMEGFVDKSDQRSWHAKRDRNKKIAQTVDKHDFFQADIVQNFVYNGKFEQIHNHRYSQLNN